MLEGDHLLGIESQDASKPIDAVRSLEEIAPSEESLSLSISEEAKLDDEPQMASQTKSTLEKRNMAAEMAEEIEVGSELNAVLETLTPRERSIMEILIKHGGKMTQMDMRYETGVPKSTLTMVLISLEKRNLVTRKEWGRTNVVELSERFFSGEKHS